MLLRDWRKLNNITQHELGQRVGVKWLTVSRWERGICIPQPRTVAKVREITGGEVDYQDHARAMREGGAL